MFFSDGSFGLLGYDNEGNEVAHPAEAMGQLAATHPYTKMGAERTLSLARRAQSLLQAAGVEMDGSYDANHTRVTQFGTAMPAWLTIVGHDKDGEATFPFIYGRSIQTTLQKRFELLGGTYLLGDHDVSQLRERDRTNVRKGEIGFVFQSFNLIDELTVAENIELPLTYLNMKASERKERVQQIMKRMAISHRAHHFPHQLSGGQQQRVAIARAVVFGPKLILADEPTGNLDSKNGAEVMQLLTQLNQEGTTIIMVTHNEHDAQMAQRTIHLFDGKIVEQ